RDSDAGLKGASRSLPAHLARVVTRLTNARASGLVDEAVDPVLDAAARELDAARAFPRGLRGDARQALLARLDALDRELLERARATLDEHARQAIVGEAEAELAGFRDRMEPAAFARVLAAAVDRSVRERFQLPVVSFQA